MKWLFGALVFGLAGILTVQAYVPYLNNAGRPFRWNLVTLPTFVHTNVVNRNTKAIRYFMASDAYSVTNRVAELNAIRACFDQWQAVPGTILKFEEGGLVNPGVDIHPEDDRNVIFWAKQDLMVNGGFDNLRGLRGLTVVAYAGEDSIVEADIALNGIQFSWYTDINAKTGASFVEATVLHEIGHLLGLDHSPVGAATVTEGGPGLSLEAGLSADEIAASRALYPQSSISATLGFLTGRVLLGGQPVFGAAVFAEDAAGNLISGTVTRANGRYDLFALPPGNYGVRVCPLDPANALDNISLRRGWDIAEEYDTAMTAFHPTTNIPVVLKAGVTNTLDVPVRGGEPPFRIAAISRPSELSQVNTADRHGVSIRLGQSNWFVGVVSPNLPLNGATLTVTGDGLVLGNTISKPNRFPDGRHVLEIPISVSSNVTPGLRSFIVQHGTNLAYANGYLEILPAVMDFNFDGLDDLFQRRFFPRFTAPAAHPNADPDQDGFSNRHEYLTDSDPTDPSSVKFRIESVTLTATGALVRSQSASGKKFQLYGRRQLPGTPWEAVGPAMAARGSSIEFLDGAAKGEMKFYRVQMVP